MLATILQYFSVIALSSLKMGPGLALAIGFNFNFLELFTTLSIGGTTGVVVFTFLGERIRDWAKTRRQKKRKKHPQPIKIRRARRIVKIWKKYGIIGIAFLTPPLISPPFGAIIAVAFREPRPRIIAFLATGVILWSALFALLGEQVLALFEKL